MALLPTQPTKRKQALLSILIFVILLTGAVFYFGYWRTPIETTITTTIPLEPEFSAPEILLQEITERIKILDSDIFKELQLYGKLPIELEETGRSNPYIHY